MKRIPVYQPDLSGNEKKYVTECLDSTWISSKGEFIDRFESEFAAQVGSAHAIGVCNGTVALHLALVALDIGPGDEVIVPSFTYIASVNAIAYTGARPVFCDSLPDTWQMDPSHVRRLVGPKTKAIMVVHLYSGACDADRLMEICSEFDLKMIEDCAESFGTSINGKHVGTFGDIGTFSFFGNKTITTGEGGMLTCENTELAERIRLLRGQGLAKNREYWHTEIGYNYRITNICAAIGLAQLERSAAIIDEKRKLADRYSKALSGLPLCLQKVEESVSTAHWMVTVMVDSPGDRDPLRKHLDLAGVETRPAFHPVHTMPMYHAPDYPLPVASDLCARGINLPSWHKIADSEFERINHAIHSFYKGIV